MNIGVIGSGYVGLVSAACFANIGNKVYCIDKDEPRIAKLQEGSTLIYEPSLAEMVRNNIREERLLFSPDLPAVLNLCQIVFIAVGTPMGLGGAADLRAVYAVGKELGQNMNKPLIVVNKSTVPVGTGRELEKIISGALQERGKTHEFSVVSNPEFLKEGRAVADFNSPDRIILGSSNQAVLELMAELYSPMVHRNPKERILMMSLESAELTKYAANAMLATRISFINEISELCEATGANINDVREGMGLDARIGLHFLYAGIGYGGSCFPKDLQALRYTFARHGIEANILDAVEARNQIQKNWAINKINSHFKGVLAGRRFAIWGLTFKPNTDDVRDAPSLVIIKGLLSAGAELVAYDPKGRAQAEFYLAKLLSPLELRRMNYVTQAYNACEQADALILCTEWREFLAPDWQRLRSSLKSPVIFDGRTQFNPQTLRKEGFTYYAVGLLS